MKDAEGRWQKNQIASLVSMTIGKASSRPRIEASRLTVTDAGAPAIGLDFSNTGNAHARLEGVIEVRSGTEVVITRKLTDVIVPEKGTRTLIVPLGQPLPADADIEVRLTNLFAPQTTRGEKALLVHKVKTEAEAATEVVDLSLPVGGLN